MTMDKYKKTKIPSLRTFITAAISIIVTVVLLCSIWFCYSRTSAILTENYENSITQNLELINHQFIEQIDLIDSIIPLYLADTIISEPLESVETGKQSAENRLQIEKQMSYLYYSTSLASKNFTNSIYIISQDETIFKIGTSSSPEPAEFQCRELLKTLDKKEPKLICQTLPRDDGNIYFIRNLFSSNTGNYIGTFIINIDKDRFLSYHTKDLDPSWFLCLYNSSMAVFSDPDMEKECMALKEHGQRIGELSFQTARLNDSEYFVASQELSGLDLPSSVAAPKSLMFADLNSILKSYLLLLTGIVLIGLFTAIAISRAITKPIDKMIYNINQISEKKQSALPPMKIYREFDVWADSFNKMLKQLDIYYNDIFQKQLLLKNSEIHALQTQMNPHFLLNTLNTIAWKAQISDNEEIYQMVISLGEFLKANTLSKEQDCIALEKELRYVKFYIYLQQQRFEDKISCDIRVPETLMHFLIPCFSIQPLVENAIVHGLEPKTGKGKLIVQILETDDHCMEISIIDNGVGFPKDFQVRDIASSDTDSHTHIGLKNLDRRLFLLYGDMAHLSIDSTPGVCTSISFKIPISRGGGVSLHDL